jgi:hypothetical protein
LSKLFPLIHPLPSVSKRPSEVILLCPTALST